jgi:hypothetical protein
MAERAEFKDIPLSRDGPPHNIAIFKFFAKIKR